MQGKDRADLEAQEPVSGRRLEVLKAIVSDYVHTREPVGSRAIVERHSLDVSPATIRNDMAALEDAGYIHQPHTSAGRVPTDKGYRLFVDRIAAIKPLSPAERRAVDALFSQAVDLDDVVHRTARLLAQLTQQVAVVQYPTLVHACVRHVELVALAERRLLMVVITDSGRVEQRFIEAEVGEAELLALRTHLNVLCAGRSARQLGNVGAEIESTVPPGLRAVTAALVREVAAVAEGETEERVVVGGTANLARCNTDFRRTISPVLEALEENVVLLRLFTEMDPSSIQVRIGAETGHEELAETSLVSAAYGAQDAVAHLGVVGPTRMDYPAAMAAVRAVASYLSRFLGAHNL
ncbi:MAG: heat-inducible transcriptional repressor HrcA [Buchananella hordeovulneris]|nr:heat-inducible transcriptional repressor HrcA [Buchananella hordeovulneris]